MNKIISNASQLAPIFSTTNHMMWRFNRRIGALNCGERSSKRSLIREKASKHTINGRLFTNVTLVFSPSSVKWKHILVIFQAIYLCKGIVKCVSIEFRFKPIKQILLTIMNTNAHSVCDWPTISVSMIVWFASYQNS